MNASNLTGVSTSAKAYMLQTLLSTTTFPNHFLDFLFPCPPCSGLPSPWQPTSWASRAQLEEARCVTYGQVCFGNLNLYSLELSSSNVQSAEMFTNGSGLYLPVWNPRRSHRCFGPWLPSLFGIKESHEIQV